MMQTATDRELWRISNHHSLSGAGGRFADGRWHAAGHRVVYLAASAPGALLEILVHLYLDDNELPRSYNLMRVTVPNSLDIEILQVAGDSWRRDETLTRAIGDEWLLSNSTALAEVPSAIMPSTGNYLLNPEHSDAALVRIAESTTVEFDPRLLRKVNS